MTAPYRADHVGSLLRPPQLLEARAAYDQGRLLLEQLRQIEDQAILQVLELQRHAGIDVYTDGEYRRRWFAGALEESVEGIVAAPDAIADRRWQGQHREQAMATAADLGLTKHMVGAKLRQIRRLTAHEAGFLQRHAPGPFKITMPGVMTRALAWYKPGVTDKFYPAPQDLVEDFTAMLQHEVRALLDEGVSYIQLDSLYYVMGLADPQRRHNLEQELDAVIAADNASLQGARQPGVTVGLHMCRGNNRSAWITTGGYEAIAEKAFNLLDVDRFLLEYDTERAGGFEPLRFVPKGKTVVLGLISSKEPALESPDLLLRRIDEASQYIDIENLALSPQCGFASTAPGNLLTWDDQRRKLELVVQTAHKVWGP